jgi:acetolactate synthase small subunit
MQVSMSFCAAGFIAIIIALSLLARKNFQIESLTKCNDDDRKRLITMNQNLNSIISDQGLENLRQISQNDLIPTS